MTWRVTVFGVVLALALAIVFVFVSANVAFGQYLRTFDEAMAFGEASRVARRWDDAAYGFTCAAELQPDSEGAWIGLQLTALQAERWLEAKRAGEHALSLDPESSWARQRQALILYHLGEYRAAESLYRSVLADASDETTASNETTAEMQLGLGFTLVRLGEEERGHAQCELAQQSLSDDPRVPQCLALRAPAKLIVGATLEAGVRRQTSASKTRSLGSLTATAWGQWPLGLTLWSGASLSRVDTSTLGSTYTQATPTFGAGLTRDGVFVRFAGTWLLSSYEPLDDTPIFSTTLGYEGEGWSTWLTGSASFYDERTVNQWRAALRWNFSPAWSVRAGPEFSVVVENAAEDASAEWLGAGVAALRWDPTKRLFFELEGWLGARRYPVDSEGLSVWTGDELFRGGARFDMGFLFTDTLTGTFAVEGDYGDEQDGKDGDFQSLGASVGLRVAF